MIVEVQLVFFFTEMVYFPLLLDPRSVTVAMFTDLHQVLTWHLAHT
jgi:hypothetical protein